MRLFELFADNVFRLKIMEMAFERKVCIDGIRSLSLNIAQHLIKVLAFDDVAREHWIAEIDTGLEKVDDYKMKPKGKKLSGDIYYQLLWDEPLNDGIESMTNKINRMVSKNYKNCKRSSLTEAQIYEQCEKILHKVSYDIANNKYYDFKDYI